LKPQTGDLLLCKLKSKVLRESIGIAFHRKIQRLGGNVVQFSQVCIEHDLLTADEKGPLLDLNQECFGSHGAIQVPIARVGLASRSAASQSS
jgi:hypothetical protein